MPAVVTDRGHGGAASGGGPLDEARLRRELVGRLLGAAPTDGTVTPLPGVMIRRASAPTNLGHGISAPGFCVVAQGVKEIRFGDLTCRYDPRHVFVVSTAMPFTSQVVEASPESPYLAVVFDLVPELVGAVMAEAESPRPAERSPGALVAAATSPLDPRLLDAVVRLLRLADEPGDAGFLAPLIHREIVYRLLMGDQGVRVRQLAALGGQTNRVTRAISILRRDVARPLSIQGLADEVGTSPSSLHHHFKQVTGLSPLQFQKQLRLHEARRLMTGEDFDATTAGLEVGYHDASHFTRDYRRQFGNPPMRDVERLRDGVADAVSV